MFTAIVYFLYVVLRMPLLGLGIFVKNEMVLVLLALAFIQDISFILRGIKFKIYRRRKNNDV